MVYNYLGELLFNQIVENNGIRPDDLIFTKQGKPIHPDTFSRHLHKMYDRNGFPKDYHLHTMRHFFATYLLENGTSKQVTADLLGHADTAFLERTYCHPQDICKEQAAGLLDSPQQHRLHRGQPVGSFPGEYDAGHLCPCLRQEKAGSPGETGGGDGAVKISRPKETQYINKNARSHKT